MTLSVEVAKLAGWRAHERKWYDSSIVEEDPIALYDKDYIKIKIILSKS